MFFFEKSKLLPIAEKLRPAFRDAAPFPFVVLDDFLPSTLAEQLASEFPRDARAFVEPSHQFQRGKRERIQESGFVDVSPLTRHLLNEFNSLAFVDFLETLTGIKGLIPDPHFRGGGLHQVVPGGRLAIHADFNVDARRKLKRRLNVILYLNPAWDPQFGGALELWPADMSACSHRIPPILNRCVVFATSEQSYHGHPDPLACPDGITRNSLALYYYTALEPGEELRSASTRWRARPGSEERDGEGERACYSPWIEGWRRRAKYFAKCWLPPVVTRAAGRYLARRGPFPTN